MSNLVASLADERLRTEAAGGGVEPGPMVRKLFVLLHGKYGNTFSGKFATGELNPSGKDKGVRAAMLVWQSTLSKYPDDVIEIAAGRLKDQHPEFPPSLPQFEKLCDAAMPRQTHAELEGWKRLPAPVIEPVEVSLEPVGDGKDWARRLIARAEAGDRTVGLAALQFACEALGIKGRKSWQ